MYNYIPLSISGECPELPKRLLKSRLCGTVEDRAMQCPIVDETTELPAGAGHTTLILSALHASNFIY